MITAKEKRYSNIAEYILYMWQIEDLIRAYNFNLDEIEKNIIAKFDQPADLKEEIKDWYIGLIEMMTSEKITKSGHLQLLKTTITDLYAFHLQLLNNKKEKKYSEVYNRAKNNIVEFQDKLEQRDNNEIYTCLTGLYAILLMRLQKREVFKETEMAIQTFSDLLAHLSVKYKMFEEGELDIYE